MFRIPPLTRRVLVCAVAALGATASAGDQGPFLNINIIDPGQGTRLHATGELEHVNILLAAKKVNGSPCPFTVEKGVLTPHGCTLAEARFQAAFRGGIVHFKVKQQADHESIYKRFGVTPLVAPPSKQYEVEVAIADPGPSNLRNPWRNLCGDTGRWALAIPGAWSTSGELLDSQQYFTFACLPHLESNVPRGGGAIAKCVDWGYPPWADESVSLDTSMNGPGKYDERTAKRFHQVCVRMATADYCGEGSPNTVDETPIRFFDISRHNASEVAEKQDDVFISPTFSRQGTSPILASPSPTLEGIWGIDRCGRARVLCLSKARWDTLSLAGTCMDGVMARRIMDPRCLGRPVWTCSTDRTRQYQSKMDCIGSCVESDLCTESFEASPCDPPGICESWTRSDLLSGQATLFSYSAYWDKALVSFTADGRWITTSNVTHSGGHAPDDELMTFQLGGGLGSSFSQVQYEGKIFDPGLPPALQGSLGKLAKLYRCRNKETPNRYLVTTQSPTATRPCDLDDPGEAYGEGIFEGYIFQERPADRETVPLYLWKKGGQAPRFYATSTVQPTGYEKARAEPLGYLVLPSRLAYHPPAPQ